MAKYLVNFEFTQVATIEVDTDKISYDELTAYLKAADLKTVPYYEQYTNVLHVATPEGEEIY
jgi:hypothetical protein